MLDHLIHYRYIAGRRIVALLEFDQVGKLLVRRNSHHILPLSLNGKHCTLLIIDDPSPYISLSRELSDESAIVIVEIIRRQ